MKLSPGRYWPEQVSDVSGVPEGETPLHVTGSAVTPGRPLLVVDNGSGAPPVRRYLAFCHSTCEARAASSDISLLISPSRGFRAVSLCSISIQYSLFILMAAVALGPRSSRTQSTEAQGLAAQDVSDFVDIPPMKSETIYSRGTRPTDRVTDGCTGMLVCHAHGAHAIATCAQDVLSYCMVIWGIDTAIAS